MIDTGGSMMSTVRCIKRHGAREVAIACSHPLLTSDAVDRLDEAYSKKMVKRVLGTDGICRGDDFAKAHPWYTEVSVAPLFARVVYHINQKLSVSQLLK
jgi:ribose-phosphate pyrophosphokinase